MATNKLERTYTIPLRSDFIKVPKYYRAKRAINNIKRYITKHMKTEDVRIGNVLNEHVWSRGIKNPPGKITVKAIKEEKYVTVELEGYTYKVQKVQTEKTEKATSFKDKLAEKLKQTKDEPKEDTTEKEMQEEEKMTEKEVKTEKTDTKKDDVTNNKKETKTTTKDEK
jgi:large subunit ribosomal protein L31e